MTTSNYGHRVLVVLAFAVVGALALGGSEPMTSASEGTRVHRVFLAQERASNGARADVDEKTAETIEELVAKVLDADPATRSSGIVRLLALNHPEAAVKLREILNETENEDLKVAILTHIGINNSKAFADDVRELVDNSSGRVREAAIDTLFRLGDGSILGKMEADFAFTALALDIRRQAARLLGQYGNTRTVPVLITGLKSDNEAIRRASGAALRDLTLRPLGDEAEVWSKWYASNSSKTLVQLYRERAIEVQKEYAQFKAQVADVIIDTLKARSNPNDTKPLIQVLKDGLDKVRLYSLGELTVLGKSGKISLAEQSAVIPVLRQLMEAPGNNEVKVKTVQLLGTFENGSVVAILIEACRQPEAFVRSAAAQALALHSDERVTEALLELLSDTSEEVVVVTASALATQKSTDAVEPLCTLLENKSAKTREAAAMALGAIADRRAARDLEKVLQNDASETARWWAADALGRIADPVSLDVLIDRLSDESNTGVRKSLVRALGKIGGKRAAASLKTVLVVPDLSRDAWLALIDLASEDVEALKDLEKEAVDLRMTAWQIEALAAQYDLLMEAQDEPDALNSVADDYVEVLIADGGFQKALGVCAQMLEKPMASAPVWWGHRVLILQALFDAGESSEVVEAIDTLEKIAPELGGEETKQTLLELRQKASQGTP